jgi:hypothetical protein
MQVFQNELEGHHQNVTRLYRGMMRKASFSVYQFLISLNEVHITEKSTKYTTANTLILQ